MKIFQPDLVFGSRLLFAGLSIWQAACRLPCSSQAPREHARSSHCSLATTNDDDIWTPSCATPAKQSP